MANYGCLLTAVGQAKIANAIATGTPLKLTEMAVGDGAGNPITPAPEMLTLVREVYRRSINAMAVSPGSADTLVVEMVLPGEVGPFVIREGAVFDEDGDMIAIAAVPASTKSVAEEGSTKDVVLQIHLKVASTAAVTVAINPAVVIATRTWVEGNFVHIPPGGTIGQFLRKKSNALNDYEHVDIGADGINFTVNVIEEEQTLAEGQVVVDWNDITTNGIAVYVQLNTPDAGLVRLIKGADYSIESPTRIELFAAWPAGSKILGTQNEPNSNTTPEGIGALARDKNLADVPNKPTARGNLGLSYASLEELVEGLVGNKVVTPQTLKALLDAISLAQSNGLAKVSGGDLNLIQKTGFYAYGTSTLNKPPFALASGTVIHIEAAFTTGQQGFQLAINDSPDAARQLLGFRTRSGGAWRDWVSIFGSSWWQKYQSPITNPASGQSSYQVFPPGPGLGIIHNWGKATVNNATPSLYIPFPHAFTQENPNILISTSSEMVSIYDKAHPVISITARTKNGFTVKSTFSQQMSFEWLAIGK